MNDKTSDKKTSELKPCPFCGSEAYLATISNLTRTEYVVCCNNKKCICFYIGYGDIGLYGTKEEAIKALNQRKPMERIIEKFNELEHLSFSRISKPLIELEDAIRIIREEGGLNE